MFKIKKHVTLPLLKIKPNGAPAHIRFENPMFEGKKVDKDKAAATLAHVVNLETGQEMQIIVPVVLQNILNEEYPDNSYVGKGFQVTLTRVPEKRYNTVGLAELELKDFEIPEFTGQESANMEHADESSNVAQEEPETARSAADKKKAKKK